MTEPSTARPRLPGLRPRDPGEEHRASTPLELFFDLCFVTAVAQVGARLVHAVGEGGYAHGLAGYAVVFFAIWWAWMNFTWFASAYDDDGPLYRVATLVQIAGALVFSAGIPRAFEEADFSVTVAGYVVMRLALCFQWLRAARGEDDAAARRTALRYAGGLLVVQAWWVLLLFLPDGLWWYGALLGIAADVAVPAVAERDRATAWHPEHIAERYGLFTLIVLGESVTAAALAVQASLDDEVALAHLLPVAAGGLLLVFAAFWIYFAAPIAEHLTSNRRAFLWGYGHYLIFASAAAIGAGLEVAVERIEHKAHIPALAAAAAVTVPAAVFVFMVWALHSRHSKRDAAEQAVLPVTAALLLACTFAGTWAVPAAGAVAVLAVVAGARLAGRDLAAG
ncbi:low temperature requirement protein A [Actinomadura parmotrematis]|uniref:Low temperature requirement protein A n=1 Tax=Actinomadura parmotrematis TaxID=2864039 RepID=A0ABS7FS13_9ACTN|nr:low temperature requirement protein A [Actinomadura parmotrematis]MBW8483101.1 low temperature requirement protein A [Actinomadura parmotrematis]